MKMREAFKRLLDGEKITRPDWHENAHIRYNKNLNTFILRFWDGSEDVCPDPCFEGGLHPYISFNGEDTEGQMVIENDDKNEIWITPQEHMELDAMRWRLGATCRKNGSCGSCPIDYIKKKEYDGMCPLMFRCDIEKLSDKEVKNLYNLIEGEKK